MRMGRMLPAAAVVLPLSFHLYRNSPSAEMPTQLKESCFSSLTLTLTSVMSAAVSFARTMVRALVSVP